MGLERLAVVCQGVNSLFEVDTVMNITNKVSELTGAYYGKSEKMDVSLRVITDHIRSATFLIGDGVLPSNEGRGYVLRRLLRRAARHGKLLGVNEAFLYKVVDTVIHENECEYPELREKQEYITRVIRTEEESFAKTIDAGMKIFSDLLAEHKAKGESTFSGADAFKLYDTYGFPIDLTIEMCADEGMGVNDEEFKELMQQQRVRAREARKALGDLGWAGIEFGKSVPDTRFVGYDTLECEAKVLAIVAEGGLCDEITEGSEAIVVLDQTCLYAEMGGQVADHGRIEGEGSFKVNDVQKNKGGKYMHYGVLEKGALKVGDSVRVNACAARRAAISRAHSATHLLHSALREVLGGHVHQAGSLVEPDVLRFDFTHYTAITPEELRAVEDRVNEAILAGYPVETVEMSIEEAKKSGATALFGEKYGSSVRVVSMSEFSRELCGGTHLSNTAKAGAFHIVSEGSVASGVRRIEAYTGKKTLETLRGTLESLSSIAAIFKAPVDAAADRVRQQGEELKEARRQIEQFKAKESAGGAESMLAGAKEIGGVHVVTVRKKDLDANALRQLGDVLRDKDSSVVAVIASVIGDKITLQCVCGQDAIDKGVCACDVIRAVAPLISGKGGGKRDSAMGGGSDLNKLDEALAAVEKFVSEKL